MFEVTWREDDNLALAISTGIDSMTLLHILHTEYKDTYKRLVCFHVNHGLRKESEEEEAYIKEYCHANDIKLYIKKLDLKAIIEKQKSIQAISREMRYAWFDEMMEQTSSDILLTGHHRDDQKETILYRIFTGKIGRTSLGIKTKYSRGDYIISRPLINVSKSDLYAYQKKHRYRYFEDKSNDEIKYTRNYIRHEVIPAIDRHNDLSANQLIELNEWMEYARALVKDEAIGFINKAVVEHTNIEINREQFNALNELVKVQVLDVLFEKHVQQKFSLKAYREWFEVFENFNKQSIMPMCDDWQIVVAYDKLLLCERNEVSNDLLFITNNEKVTFSDWYIETGDLSSRLSVRTRAPGDRIEYKDKEQIKHKKVNRIMIDKKMDIHKRDQCPIIVKENRIIAVGNLWIDKDYKNVLTITYNGDDCNE